MMPLEHGTVHAYKHHRCRCAACKKAASEYHRKYSRRTVAGPVMTGRPDMPLRDGMERRRRDMFGLDYVWEV